jgi:asparagine N-glycosylation enzyme membrane subunit Stt3
MTKEITINTRKIKKNISNGIDFLKQKKIANILLIILFLITLFVGVQIRVQNLPNLIDVTTEDYVPLALDPYYFLRISETLVQNNGILPEIDSMRYLALSPGWSPEILPQTTVMIYRTMQIFNSSTTLSYANVLNPVIFFALGLILFFFLCWKLSKNKWIALIASFILTVIPPYLYRTLAGFSDHESIGMFAFFLALLLFSLGLLYLEKGKTTYWKSSVFGFISGIAAMIAIASWGGGARFLFMILPLSFLIIWFTKKEKSLLDYVLFYSLWVVGILFSSSFFNYKILDVIRGYFLSSAGILTLFVLGYSIVNFLLLRAKKLPSKISKYKTVTSFSLVVVLGLICYQIFIGSSWDLIINLFNKIIYPFGTSRIGLTVAENKQPYLNDWIAQTSKLIFYTFLAGCFIVGAKLAKGIQIKKYRTLFVGSFAFFVCGILFSRISVASMFNGENFISKLLFLASFLILLLSSIHIYRKSEWKIESRWIIIAVWMIPMLLAVRSAIRVFFAIVPFVAFMVPLVLFEIGKFARKAKDDFVKGISFLILIILIISLLFTIIGFYKTVDLQSTYQFPSYDSTWQKAMSWVRDNTAEGSIFVHWWDYGYWVQTGGNRPSLTDGGHFNSYWDHLIGRYVLTTPNPDTALSFMKTHNVSYLLIDPSELGKYPAYSSIGSDDSGKDRFGQIPIITLNEQQTSENENGIMRVYNGGFPNDKDLIYNFEGNEIFLPSDSSIIAAITVQTLGSIDSEMGIAQPQAIFVYNNNQINIPLRYVYYNGELIDYGSGIEAGIRIIPKIAQSPQGGIIVDDMGSAIYLSEKTFNSLVGQVYILENAFKNYDSLSLSHTQSNMVIESLKLNGINLGEYIYYNGFQGPLKIWEVNYPSNIIEREEFLRTSGEYAEFDDLQFTQ